MAWDLLPWVLSASDLLMSDLFVLDLPPDVFLLEEGVGPCLDVTLWREDICAPCGLCFCCFLEFLWECFTVSSFSGDEGMSYLP